MKRCPTCNRTYTDDALSYCLDDGTPLASASAPPSYDPNATISLNQAASVNQPAPPPTVAYRPAPPVVNQVAPTPSWSPMPAQQPRQRRRTWPWILGVLLIVAVLGIGLVVLLVSLASMNSNTNNSNANSNNSNIASKNSNRNSNTNNTNSPNSNLSNANRNTNSAPAPTVSLHDDFSIAKWGSGNYSYGSIWYENQEYHMHAVDKGYIVMYGPDADYSTENATVRATVRSVDGKSPNAGYGLVVDGEKTKDKNELEDYAFLIYTGDNPSYSVAMHRNSVQTTLVPWTKSSVIRTGANPNQLEVRINGKQLAFYINGQYITTITDTGNFQRGLAGFYTSDTDEVAFDDLEIYR